MALVAYFKNHVIWCNINPKALEKLHLHNTGMYTIVFPLLPLFQNSYFLVQFAIMQPSTKMPMYLLLSACLLPSPEAHNHTPYIQSTLFRFYWKKKTSSIQRTKCTKKIRVRPKESSQFVLLCIRASSSKIDTVRDIRPITAWIKPVSFTYISFGVFLISEKANSWWGSFSLFRQPLAGFFRLGFLKAALFP